MGEIGDTDNLFLYLLFIYLILKSIFHLDSVDSKAFINS